ncbi:NAD(+) synthase [Alkalibacillus salilacus]|uniref:NH(3)-dependent NAD(+) synthetase n=1 Tax=Alkalibacillus salilacus TaxID=284582 RepID=A0ABT9VF27_9BACI|nr:NAD(+) synthase [Alkalibacillus salilacus]MDQ0159576.1 NAD+ synthase [Alkalibacillus salilacus]
MEARINYIVNWMQDYVDDAGADGVIVGVSGGIDSALAAALMQRGFPGRSLGVIMPINQTVTDQADALDLVHTLDMPYYGIELTETYQTQIKTIQAQLQEQWNTEQEQLVRANLQARIRMGTLYALAQNFNYLVVGTGNKAETYTGYFTKYGDGASDMEPLRNLTKKEVYQMSEYLGVSDAILNKQPSAGLWEGQTDEKEMGVSYDHIDAFLRGEDIPNKSADIIKSLHKRSAHKREVPPGPMPYRKGDA